MVRKPIFKLTCITLSRNISVIILICFSRNLHHYLQTIIAYTNYLSITHNANYNFKERCLAKSIRLIFHQKAVWNKNTFIVSHPTAATHPPNSEGELTLITYRHGKLDHINKPVTIIWELCHHCPKYGKTINASIGACIMQIVYHKCIKTKYTYQ